MAPCASPTRATHRTTTRTAIRRATRLNPPSATKPPPTTHPHPHRAPDASASGRSPHSRPPQPATAPWPMMAVRLARLMLRSGIGMAGYCSPRQTSRCRSVRAASSRAAAFGRGVRCVARAAWRVFDGLRLRGLCRHRGCRYSRLVESGDRRVAVGAVSVAPTACLERSRVAPFRREVACWGVAAAVAANPALDRCPAATKSRARSPGSRPLPKWTIQARRPSRTSTLRGGRSSPSCNG